ncbi:MAG TPA: precorrin-6y C5,15-methyltransferase (decarboxylating) subunit CbiE [Victivallales bacterium]|nr:precorrin-6y C5,15-methyltransferase (decarboxylating) subunit CbiE [Victivallales bacterium]HRR27930.1 precorrin-6y C5,15-methyltransferase (decarboxylating) subunit CbiE [Victivallales bacterium]
MKSKITIAGCGIAPGDITEKIRKIVNNSDIIIGGKRILDFFYDFKGTKITISNNIDELIEKIRKLKERKKITILASGDPLFYGIGKTLSSKFSSDEIEIIPNISAMQALFAKLKLPWEKAKFFSIHGQKKINYNSILTSELAIIYCDNKTKASDLAKILIEKFPKSSKRPAILAEQLGTEKEKIINSSLAKIAKQNSSELSILLLLPQNSFITDPGFSIGLPDSEYFHEKNMITHPEVRVIAISKLKPGPGIIWDLGAGSGSVGIEIASLSEDIIVHSVESNRSRCKNILQNIEKFGLKNIILHNANITQVIEELPPPRGVFIGGSGNKIIFTLQQSLKKILPGGRIVIPSVLLRTKTELNKFVTENKKYFVELISISISHSEKISDNYMLKPENPVDLYIFEKK